MLSNKWSRWRGSERPSKRGLRHVPPKLRAPGPTTAATHSLVVPSRRADHTITQYGVDVLLRFYNPIVEVCHGTIFILRLRVLAIQPFTLARQPLRDRTGLACRPKRGRRMV
ncbi:hypothetical protein EVAR_65777_1 [Eumeta japonica]|uniref:Uncharacterized protein n=1 Tax=Eumeta variegata TaxID=151549 RepID=A0A4C2A316_EUMVA|nr:hypothetical protein EVAR_65777_1 [Eumeta japonica]